ncbi:DUF6571 family protein [Streptomyces sp. NPDC002734]|uniref:DUF6571 family protein n=1 Tax=Streptomyces sp. NPDC002734 TaxID=3154426 RepID=UPI0033280305
MADIATLTVEELRHLRLGTLNEAVTNWRVMADKLNKLATGGSGDVSARDLESKAKAADWEGVNATVSREFVTKTAKQFEDAAAEAKDVLGILSDLASQMAKHKESLETAISELRGQHILVLGDGTIVNSGPKGPPKEHLGTAKVSQESLEAAKARITRILWEATEADRIARDALRAIMKDQHDFSGAGAGSLKEADMRQGREQAEKWKKDILSGDYKRWNDAELEAFNRSLVLHRDNPAFTETFFTGIGADQTLQMWLEIASNDGPADEDRPKLLAKIQDNLSMSLANASYGDSPAVEQWKKDLITAGPRYVSGDPPAVTTGFQVMSSLMQKGRFESAFLHDYGTALVTHEREKLRGSGEPWSSGATLNYPDNGKNPNDPMAGFLEALGHNPEASLDFLNQETGEGDKRISNFEYLVGNEEHGRKWPEDTDGFDNLGHALESATLGYAYDSKEPVIPPVETLDQITTRSERTALAMDVVGAYADPELLEKQQGIEGSLARVAAGHMDSINYTMADWGSMGDAGNRDGFYGKNEAYLRDFGEGDTIAFLRNVAADEGAHQTLSQAQQIYGTSLIAAHSDNQEDALHAGGQSVRMHGLIDEARLEAIASEFSDEETKRNKELEKQAAWVEFGAGALVGVGTGLVTAPTAGVGAVAVPIVADTVGSAVETVVGNHMMDWLEENEYKNDAASIKSLDEARVAGSNNATAPVREYMEQHGLTERETRAATKEMERAYNDGRALTDTDNAEK